MKSLGNFLTKMIKNDKCSNSSQNCTDSIDSKRISHGSPAFPSVLAPENDSGNKMEEVFKKNSNKSYPKELVQVLERLFFGGKVQQFQVKQGR